MSRILKCVEKYSLETTEDVYVIVSVKLLVDRKLVSVRLHRFSAFAPIGDVASHLRREYQADRIDYQPFLFPPI
jgi:hypothetical protein